MMVLPYGEAALLAEPDDPAIVLALADALRDDGDVLEVVPAARTLLVRAAPAAITRIGERVRELAETVSASVGAAGQEIVLDVHYDGADLRDTAAEVGLDVDELVRRHREPEYVVAFCGFAPGFAYLTGLDAALRVPRRREPRTRVPAGSVAIAGEFTGVYPRPTPGGWRLLGHTDAHLWDLERTPPALLVPGTRVRFRPA
jgi:5-oxoprolinase (ATP-hydrolysing) subunit B